MKSLAPQTFLWLTDLPILLRPSYEKCHHITRLLRTLPDIWSDLLPILCCLRIRKEYHVVWGRVKFSFTIVWANVLKACHFCPLACILQLNIMVVTIASGLWIMMLYQKFYVRYACLGIEAIVQGTWVFYFGAWSSNSGFQWNTIPRWVSDTVGMAGMIRGMYWTTGILGLAEYRWAVVLCCWSPVIRESGVGLYGT